MAFIYRFSSALSENKHLHVVVIDGVFEPNPGQSVGFIAAQAINANAVRVEADDRAGMGVCCSPATQERHGP